MKANLDNLAVAQASSTVVSMTGDGNNFVKNARIRAVTGKHVSLILNGKQGDEIVAQGRIAFSCLVAPQENDTAVCVRDESGTYIVLAIVDRPDEGPDSQDMTLKFPASARLLTADGDLKLVAKDEISMLSGESLFLGSRKAVHHARQAVINYQDISAQGNSISARYKSMQLLCDRISSMVKQALQKYDHYVRHSSENDQVSAGFMERKVEGLYSMNTRTTLMTSKKDTRIDAERIHMG